MKRFLTIALVLVLSGCIGSHGTYTPEFLVDSTLRMEVGKEQILSYNPLTCQIASNRERLEFRLHTDTVSDYFVVRLDEMPTEEDQIVNANYLTWTSRKGADQVRKNIALQVVKLEDDTIWLWNQSESIRMTVRFQ